MQQHVTTVEFLLENVLNLIGFLVGLTIGIMSYIGFRNTGSPVLFRLALAFSSISAGFFVIWVGFTLEDFVFKTGSLERWVQVLGIALQTVGYFFIAFSHSIKSFFPKSRHLRSVGAIPLFLLSATQIEHVLRSVSFILLVYAAIETILSYAATRRKGTVLVGAGLGMLAAGEFVGWYSIIFPDPSLYYASVLAKIAGLISLFAPVSRMPMRKINLKEFELDQNDEQPG